MKFTWCEYDDCDGEHEADEECNGNVRKLYDIEFTFEPDTDDE